jgi:hypothetical protein
MGLFDPSMFTPDDPRTGLFARLAQTVNQPGQPGDATASAPPQQQPAPQGGGGVLGALQSFLGNHQNALMGLGAGIASGGCLRAYL